MSAADAAVQAMAREIHAKSLGCRNGRCAPNGTDLTLARAALDGLVGNADVRAALVAAVENSGETCHAGSPRGISGVDCYVPVDAAVDAILAALDPGAVTDDGGAGRD